MRRRRELGEAGEVSREEAAPEVAPATGVAEVLALQQQAGNAAVSRMLARKAAAAPTMDDALEPEPDAAGGRAARGEAGAQVPAPAQAAAAQMGALAYTVGEFIVLAPGGARSGDLVGHELAHVLQQRRGRVQV